MEARSDLIPGLPDEVALLCLARLPFGLHPLLSCVCSSWRRALKLPLLFDIRARLGFEEHLVFVWAPAEPGLLSRKCTQFYLIDPRLSKCHPLPHPPVLPPKLPYRFHCDVLALGRQIYISRIHSGQSWGCPQELLCFDVVSRVWCTPPPPMLESRTWSASATVDGYVYAAGDGTGPKLWNLKSAERFDLASKKWERIPDMTEKRIMASGIAWKGSFYVLGGWQFIPEGNHIRHGSAEVWDASKEEWQLIPGILPDYIRTVAIVKGKLYALKHGHVKEVMLLDEKAKHWIPLGSLTDDLQGDAEHELIGVGDELWMPVKDVYHKCTLFSTDPESLPLCWRLLPLCFENYPSNVCVITL